jgi:signal peptidase I
LSSVKLLACGIAAYLAVRALFVEAYQIPSGSMVPTMLAGDWILVNKLVFGPRVPFTAVSLPGYRGPHRGDVVVFLAPRSADQASPTQPPGSTTVKRVIGVPSDTIYMRAGLVYVNGIPYPQGAVSRTNPKGDPDETSELFLWQRQIEAHGTRFGEPPAVITHDNWGPLLVRSGGYFMLGDSRYASRDSRYWGLVGRSSIVGMPLIVYFSYAGSAREGGHSDQIFDPSSRPDAADGPLTFIEHVRWRRIGRWVR